MTTKKRICLEDINERVSALKCVAFAEKETKNNLAKQEVERKMVETVDYMMTMFTEAYIREKIIAAKLKGNSSASLILFKCVPGVDDHTVMFYKQFDEHPESVKERIESFIDTTSMCVVVDKDCATHFQIHLYWGHFMYRPLVCLSQPCGVILLTLCVSSLAFLVFLISQGLK